MRTAFSGRALSFVAFLPLLVACSSDDGAGKGTPSEESAGDGEETYLGLETPEPGKGFQLRSVGTRVEPGADAEFCEVGALPGDPSETFYVDEIELANGDNSHHLIIDAAEAGTDADARLAEMAVGDTVKCLSAETAFGTGFVRVGGIQRPYGKQSFPEGVGRIYHGGQRFVFDYHYYNTTDRAVDARSAVNFRLTDEASVQHIATSFGFYNWTIDTPVGAQSSFTGECKFSQDVTLSQIVRHTHRWGTDYEVWFLGGARDGEHIWTSQDFQEDTNFAFDAPFVMKAGEGFRFRCDFDNTEDHELRFGTNATDEMCILFGEIWEGSDGEVLAKQDCRITQIGDDGIGRPAADDGGFRPPTPGEVAECVDKTAESTTLSPACSDCACNHCGGVLADCQSDADCAAILECVQTSGCTGATCVGACESVINAHSSGTGMVVQVSDCLTQECSSECTSITSGN